METENIERAEHAARAALARATRRVNLSPDDAGVLAEQQEAKHRHSQLVAQLHVARIRELALTPDDHAELAELLIGA